jgi:tRNA (adenine37-N6)-methyltransferase
MPTDAPRPGEIALPFDPGTRAGDGHVVFIGRIRTTWTARADTPKNPREARERGQTAHLELHEPFRAGLDGLERFSHAIVLYWMHRARRDLIVQSPKHSPVPRGVFGLRSPLRPNPIALAVVRLLVIDAAAGRIDIDAIDCLDGTPLLDIKPYLPSVDAVPDAVGR